MEIYMLELTDNEGYTFVSHYFAYKSWHRANETAEAMRRDKRYAKVEVIKSYLYLDD